jgi:SAM-dependent methyltransferase
MDRSDNAPSDLESALDDIRLVNRFLRGSGILVSAVRPFLRSLSEGETLRVLDVGTGGADLPLDLVTEARRLRRRIRIVAVDRDLATLAYARRKTADNPEIEVLPADAFELPFPPASFDLVTASLFLHHFSEDDAARLLSGFRRLARRAVLINDLERHLVAWALIGLAGRITRRHPMFVHDAALSVLRGFTPEELRAIAARAGAAGASVRKHVPYRLLLTMPADGAA